MSETDAVKEFKQGLELLHKDFAKLALPHMRKAVQLDKKNPFYISYLGVALAEAEGKWEDAETLCNVAIRMKRTQAELYVNLSKVYCLAGRKQDAVETLSTGMLLTRRDPRISKALHKLGLRRTPPFPFLDRDHFLNRLLGTLRHRMFQPASREA